MKVRLAADLSGTRDGVPWPPRGSLVELPDEEAVIMLENGIAQALRDDDDPEKAVIMTDSVENATVTVPDTDDRRPVLDHDRERMGTVDTSHATEVLRDADTGEPLDSDTGEPLPAHPSSGLTTSTGPTRRAVSKNPPKK